MHALLCIFLVSIRLCLESGDKESVGCTCNDDIGMVLYEVEGLVVFPERQAGEASEGWSELW